MKTFSFIDFQNQDFIRLECGKIVKVTAYDHEDASEDFFCSNEHTRTDWTNTGTVTWCWEDMA